jgi:hypothetical protein
LLTKSEGGRERERESERERNNIGDWFYIRRNFVM